MGPLCTSPSLALRRNTHIPSLWGTPDKLHAPPLQASGVNPGGPRSVHRNVRWHIYRSQEELRRDIISTRYAKERGKIGKICKTRGHIAICLVDEGGDRMAAPYRLNDTDLTVLTLRYRLHDTDLTIQTSRYRPHDADLMIQAARYRPHA